ncbi:hypothetical protein SpCBS45565_g01787 [Spizellomyces sp. 'palustris']|nr:hypothetical protein SpCBS45565_g01787 [Spizellomyces sp. 'palustris']
MRHVVKSPTDPLPSKSAFGEYYPITLQKESLQTQMHSIDDKNALRTGRGDPYPWICQFRTVRLAAENQVNRDASNPYHMVSSRHAADSDGQRSPFNAAKATEVPLLRQAVSGYVFESFAIAKANFKKTAARRCIPSSYGQSSEEVVVGQPSLDALNPNLPAQPGSSGFSRRPTLPQQQWTDNNSYTSSSSQLQAPPTPIFRPAVILNSSCTTPVSSTGSPVSDSRSSTPCPAKSPSLQLPTSLFNPPIRGPEDENFLRGQDDLETMPTPETETVKVSDNSISQNHGYAEAYMADSANRSTRERIIEYIQLYHLKDIMKAIFDAQRVKAQRTSTKERYCVILHIDPALLLNYDENIGNEVIRGLAEDLKEDFASAPACFWHVEKATRAQSGLFPEHVRAAIRLAYMPAIPELHFYNFREVFNYSRGELCKVTKQNLVAIRGIVSCLHLPFHTM